MVRLLVRLDRTKYPHRGVKKAEELDKLLKEVKELAERGKIKEAIILLFRWKPHATIDYLAERLGVSERTIREAVSRMVADKEAMLEEI